MPPGTRALACGPSPGARQRSGHQGAGPGGKPHGHRAHPQGLGAGPLGGLGSEGRPEVAKALGGERACPRAEQGDRRIPKVQAQPGGPGRAGSLTGWHRRQGCLDAHLGEGGWQPACSSHPIADLSPLLWATCRRAWTRMCVRTLPTATHQGLRTPTQTAPWPWAEVATAAWKAGASNNAACLPHA